MKPLPRVTFKDLPGQAQDVVRNAAVEATKVIYEADKHIGQLLYTGKDQPKVDPEVAQLLCTIAYWAGFIRDALK